MTKLDTIGDRANRVAAELAVAADPQAAYRWTCPLCDEQSSLYVIEARATEDFEAHLATHTIQQAFAVIKTVKWLTAFTLSQPANTSA